MKKIFRSQLYQLLRDGAEYRMLLIFTAGLIGFGILVGATSDDIPCGSRLIIDNTGLLWMFQLILIGIMCGNICAGDFSEKDINYEIMNGHARSELFFARAVLGAIIPAAISTLLAFVPVIANSLIYGFGDLLDPGNTIIRMLLLFFPFLRYAAFFVLIAFITKNRFSCIITSFVTMMTGMILMNLLPDSPFLMVILNLGKLVRFTGWSVYNIDPVKGIVEYYTYDSAAEPGLIIGTIAISLVITAIYLFAAYGFFKKDDLD